MKKVLTCRFGLPALLMILGALIYLPRLAELPFRGEEPRRVICAFEMLQSGNFVVPTIQNEVFLSRPPFQNWVIAGLGAIRGSFDHLTGRLPSVFFLLMTALLIYGYARVRLSHAASFFAALCFITFPQVIQLGITAETELMFTFFLSGSFLLWHKGELDDWSPWFKWSIAYFFLALATLTKGINQAPLYFAAIIGCYLLFHRKLKSFVTLSHLVGLSLFLFIVGFWQWQFIQDVGSKVGWMMHAGDVGLRFKDMGVSKYLEHALVFPIELVAVLLPWSIFFVVYFSRKFWMNLSSQIRPIALFSISAIAITILTVWYPPLHATISLLCHFKCNCCSDTDRARF